MQHKVQSGKYAITIKNFMNTVSNWSFPFPSESIVRN